MAFQIPGKLVGVVFLVITVGITFFTPIGAWKAYKIERAKINDAICNYNYCMNQATRFIHYERSGESRDKKGYCEEHAANAPETTALGSSLAMVFFFSLFILAVVTVQMSAAALKGGESYSFVDFSIRLLAILFLLFLPWLFVPVFWH